MPSPSSRLQGMTAQHPSHNGHPQWVANTCANTHITNELRHLSLAREYHGSDNVGGVLGGTGLPIENIGHSRFSHLNSSFNLNDVLHCPDAFLPLLCVHKFATNNHCFFTFFTVTPRTGSAVARYCPLWAWLHSHKPARFCFWELTKQLPRVVTHPGIAPASNSLNFGVPTNPKPVSSQKASRYEDARCAI
ncbi:hypothetical protein L3X38_024328 [Prunus dulcis]|uniref:Uncharacterized protein n=1 Tax=Prunus dulcis TaxID=3755 RepID=A0AAD4Z621_PRUDU|nr:hypothetical protein L3X38_024328 [Prunus dulcis]